MTNNLPILDTSTIKGTLPVGRYIVEHSFSKRMMHDPLLVLFNTMRRPFQYICKGLTNEDKKMGRSQFLSWHRGDRPSP